MTAIRYKTKLGKRGDDIGWNPDTAIEHAINPYYEDKRTLCGVLIGCDINSGGNWEISNYSHVSCRRCKKLLHENIVKSFRRDYKG